MIVQDKNANVEICGAVRFGYAEARKSLMNYPGVTVAASYPNLTQNVQEIKVSVIRDFAVNGESINDGDYLVTDKSGHTTVYNPTTFKEKFERVGDENGIS